VIPRRLSGELLCASLETLILSPSGLIYFKEFLRQKGKSDKINLITLLLAILRLIKSNRENEDRKIQEIKFICKNHLVIPNNDPNVTINFESIQNVIMNPNYDNFTTLYKQLRQFLDQFYQAFKTNDICKDLINRNNRCNADWLEKLLKKKGKPRNSFLNLPPEPIQLMQGIDRMITIDNTENENQSNNTPIIQKKENNTDKSFIVKNFSSQFINNENFLKHFEEYLQSQKRLELILFYKEVELYKAEQVNGTRINIAKSIMKKYINYDGEFSIGIEDDLRNYIIEKLDVPNTILEQNLFDEPQALIFHELDGSLPKFFVSQNWEDYVESIRIITNESTGQPIKKNKSTKMKGKKKDKGKKL